MIVEIAQAPCSNYICHKFGFLHGMIFWVARSFEEMRDNSLESYELNNCADPLPSALEMAKPPQKGHAAIGTPASC